MKFGHLEGEQRYLGDLRTDWDDPPNSVCWFGTGGDPKISIAIMGHQSKLRRGQVFEKSPIFLGLERWIQDDPPGPSGWQGPGLMDIVHLRFDM